MSTAAPAKSPTETAAQAKDARRQLRTLRGLVVSAKAAKTVKVKIEYSVRHPKYGKYLSRRTVLQVHDEKGLAKEGDTVDIAECRPMSKTKHHRLVKVVVRGAAAVKAEEPSEQVK